MKEMNKEQHPTIIRLLAYLKKHKETQKEFAMSIGYSPEALSKLILGVSPMSKKSINGIEFGMMARGGHIEEPTDIDPLLKELILSLRELDRTDICKVIIFVEQLNKAEAAPVTQPGEPKQIKARPGFHGTQNKLRGIPLMILQQAIGE